MKKRVRDGRPSFKLRILAMYKPVHPGHARQVFLFFFSLQLELKAFKKTDPPFQPQDVLVQRRFQQTCQYEGKRIYGQGLLKAKHS